MQTSTPRRTIRKQPKAQPAWGNLVRAHRAAAALRREDLAQASGISYSMLTKVELGERTPSPQLLRKLGDVLGESFWKAAVTLLVHQYLVEEA